MQPLRKNKILVTIFVFLSFFLLLIVACSGEPDLTGEDNYVLVYEKENKVYWFNPGSVQLFEESTEKTFVEAMVHIEHKASHPIPMKEYSLWYFHPEESKYKPTSVYFYDYEDALLEE